LAREIQDDEGVRWSCAQAYAGLSKATEDAAAQVDGREDHYRVVCTPSGGSRSVEVELPGGWEEGLSDEEILDRIRSAQE